MSVLKKCSVAQQLCGRISISLFKKTYCLLFLPILLLFLFCACGPSNEEKEKEYREKSALISQKLSSAFPSLATDTVDGITRNFVREAQIKCRVSNVLTTTKHIEALVKKHRGYISSDELNSTLTSTQRIVFKKDSTVDLNQYQMIGLINLRIPNKELDTVLQQISEMSLFIDYRKLRANDVKMDLYAGEQAKSRYNNYSKRLEQKLETVPGQLRDIAAAEANLLEKQSLADQAYRDSYILAENVNYGVIYIELYQNPQIEKVILPGNPTIDPYSPTFQEEIKNSLTSGFHFLSLAVLFLLKCWGLILLAFVLLVFYRKIKRFVFKNDIKI